MKILQVVERYYPSIGGVESHVYHLSREMAQLGNEVSVVTSHSIAANDVRGISSAGLTLNSSFPKLQNHEFGEAGVRIHRFKPKIRFYTQLFTPGMVSYLFRHMKDNDIIHTHNYLHAEPSIVMLLAKLKRKKFVLTAHDLVSSYGGFLEAIKKCGDLAIGKNIFESAAALIALTPVNKEEYLKLGAPKSKIRVIPNGIVKEAFVGLQPSEAIVAELGNPERVVLFVGRFVPYKGAQYIIKAVGKIISEFPATKFVFVGKDDGYLPTLRRLAYKAQVQEKCVFMEGLSDEKLRQMYATADVFVLPSTYEGFGIAPLESIAAGTPVILANSGGLSHILTELGGIPLDMHEDIVDQISNAVKAVFRNRMQESIDRQRKKVLDSYSWHEIAGRLLEVYEEVLLS